MCVRARSHVRMFQFIQRIIRIKNELRMNNVLVVARKDFDGNHYLVKFASQEANYYSCSER
jgi:hypothetical protein